MEMPNHLVRKSIVFIKSPVFGQLTDRYFFGTVNVSQNWRGLLSFIGIAYVPVKCIQEWFRRKKEAHTEMRFGNKT